MKLVIGILMVAVMISLGSALFSMSSPAAQSPRMVRALTVRVILSIGLVLALLVSWKLGYIEPHSGG